MNFQHFSSSMHWALPRIIIKTQLNILCHITSSSSHQQCCDIFVLGFLIVVSFYLPQQKSIFIFCNANIPLSTNHLADQHSRLWKAIKAPAEEKFVFPHLPIQKMTQFLKTALNSCWALGCKHLQHLMNTF